MNPYYKLKKFSRKVIRVNGAIHEVQGCEFTKY